VVGSADCGERRARPGSDKPLSQQYSGGLAAVWSVDRALLDRASPIATLRAVDRSPDCPGTGVVCNDALRFASR